MPTLVQLQRKPRTEYTVRSGSPATLGPHTWLPPFAHRSIDNGIAGISILAILMNSLGLTLAAHWEF